MVNYLGDGWTNLGETFRDWRGWPREWPRERSFWKKLKIRFEIFGKPCRHVLAAVLKSAAHSELLRPALGFVLLRRKKTRKRIWSTCIWFSSFPPSSSSTVQSSKQVAKARRGPQIPALVGGQWSSASVSGRACSGHHLQYWEYECSHLWHLGGSCAVS